VFTARYEFYRYTCPRLYRTSVIKDLFFSYPPAPPPFTMFYHSDYVGYTGLSYIGSSVTSDFSDIPRQLIFLGYTFFGVIMDSSQRLQCVRAQRATRQSDMKTACVI
jgi:hypothetical protein